MRLTSLRRLVKFLAVVVVLILSAQILLNRVKVSKHLPKLSPLTAEEFRLISPETYQYILNQPSVCRDREPFLLFMVPVSPLQAQARDAIRDTWGARGQDTLTLFYVGLPEEGQGSSTQKELEEESRKHADIVQMNFQDSYHNLTIKTMMMMNWLAAHCANATYAMKVDADIFVNVFYLMERLESSPRQDFITGSVIWDGKPRRDRQSKWHVSKELYPEDSFPPYVSGAGYVFSADLAAKISWASRFVQMIPLEDVYVGLCLRVLDVRPVYSRSLLTFRNLFEIRTLEYDRCTFSKLVIVNGFKPSKLRDIWEDFTKSHAERLNKGKKVIGNTAMRIQVMAMFQGLGFCVY